MTQQGTVTVVVEEKKEDTLCRHHWLIEAPMGPHESGYVPHLWRDQGV